jgi:hypothetical protein
MNDFLQWFFVLDYEDYGHVLQFPPPRSLKPRRFHDLTQWGAKCSKVNINVPSLALTSQLFKSQLGNLRRVFNPQPADRDDLLGDKLRDGVVAIFQTQRP